MRDIEISVINPSSVREAELMMQTAARLTQRGEKISGIEDFQALHNKPLNKELIRDLCELPHPTLQKFGIINVAVTGLSRRALAQITRHQNEVKFMSSSLQYSDYSEVSMFLMPPGLTDEQKEELQSAYDHAKFFYDRLIKMGCTPDQAGYVMPQALRGVLIISATPYQWKHMIRQRTCRRNTPEVRYLFLKTAWLLNNIAPELFGDAVPPCAGARCPEGKMSCGVPFTSLIEEIKELEDLAE